MAKNKKDSLYDASQLASLLDHSSGQTQGQGKKNAMVTDDHFESLVRDMSDWQDDHHQTSSKSPAKSSSKDFFVVVADFDIITEDFFERLEAMLAENDQDATEFKMPNLECYETRSKTTPNSKTRLVKVEATTSPIFASQSPPPKAKARLVVKEETSPIFASQSPLLVATRKAKNRAVILSSDEDEESFEVEKKAKIRPTKKKIKIKNKFIVDEAELSGSASEDEDDIDEDSLEASFVDDATQRVSIDEKAIYLQSIKAQWIILPISCASLPICLKFGYFCKKFGYFLLDIWLF